MRWRFAFLQNIDPAVIFDRRDPQAQHRYVEGSRPSKARPPRCLRRPQ